jgi:hypothetical protein
MFDTTISQHAAPSYRRDPARRGSEPKNETAGVAFEVWILKGSSKNWVAGVDERREEPPEAAACVSGGYADA